MKTPSLKDIQKAFQSHNDFDDIEIVMDAWMVHFTNHEDALKIAKECSDYHRTVNYLDVIGGVYLKQKEYEIYRDYYEKFKKVLPVKKVAVIRRAEEDFKKEIIKTIKEN